MKKWIIEVVLLVLILAIVTGCGEVQKRVSPTFPEGSHVELLMPGNTVVIGECEELLRISSGWIKVKIDGTWYACNEWRLVLKECVDSE